jgi:hypothetical protein
MRLRAVAIVEHADPSMCALLRLAGKRVLSCRRPQIALESALLSPQCAAAVATCAGGACKSGGGGRKEGRLVRHGQPQHRPPPTRAESDDAGDVDRRERC